MSEEIGEKHLRRYVEARRIVDREVKNIHSLAHLLGQFEDFDRGHAVVDRVALGLVHRTIEQSILTIWGALDEFMLTDTAHRALAGAERTGHSR